MRVYIKKFRLSNRDNYILNMLIVLISVLLVCYGNVFILSLAGLLACCMLCSKHRNNLAVFFSFLLITFFSLNFINSMVFDTTGTIFVNNLNNTDCLLISIRCFYLFIVTILVFTKKSNAIDYDISFNMFKKNDFVFYALCVVTVLFSIFGLDRVKTIYYENHISVMYELTYFLIYFELILSNKNKKKIALVFLIAIFIIVQDLMYGGRITSLQICLSFFVYNIESIKPKHYLGIAIFGLILLTIGAIREGGQISLESFNVFHIDTFYMAFEASETHVYCKGLLPFIYRFQTFLGNLLNTFFIDIGVDYNVSSICSTIVHSNGGGYCFTHFYFWFSYAGPILFGTIIAAILNLCNKNHTIYSTVIYSIFLICLPRWYCYEPFILIKYGVVWSSIIALVLKNISTHVNKIRKGKTYV